MGRKRFDELAWWQQAGLVVIAVPLLPVVGFLAVAVFFPVVLIIQAVEALWDGW